MPSVYVSIDMLNRILKVDPKLSAHENVVTLLDCWDRDQKERDGGK